MSKHRDTLRGMLLRIPEPRYLRVMQFGVYICMGFAGSTVLASPPHHYQDVLGWTLVLVFGGFVFGGGVIGAIAVLPGIWWLERVALLALSTGLAMYLVVTISLGVSTIGIIVSLAFILTFAQRWFEIKGSELAPKEV